MSSTRSTRKSARVSSPYRRTLPDPATPPLQQKEYEKRAAWDEWSEPPLRPPAPSFEDYRGVERHGVLEQMAPLGTFPIVKGKPRLKAEPPRNAPPVKNRDGVEAKAISQEPEPVVANRRSTSRKVDDAPPKTPTLRDQGYLQTVTANAPGEDQVKSPPVRAPPQGFPNSKTPSGRAKLKVVVDAAVERAYQFGHVNLGLAVKTLYEESISNRRLAELLDAVLAHTESQQQKDEFQNYIKMTRRHHKAERSSTNSTRRSSAVDAVSPSHMAYKSPSKTGRLGTRNKVSKLEAAEPRAARKTASPRKDTFGKKDVRVARVNGMATRSSLPLSRSGSASSSSSLSSLNSSLEDQSFTPSKDGKQASAAESHARNGPTNANFTANAASHPIPAPQLRTPQSSNPPTDDAFKRSAGDAGLDDDGADVTLTAKRQRLKRLFDTVQVNDSNVRDATTQREPGSSSTYPTRLRNGAALKPAGDVDGNLLSPSSPPPGDFLAPAPPTATSHSRPGTPNTQGVKPKKKAPRVKMSPIKGKSGGVAGIARAGRGLDMASPSNNSDIHRTGDNDDNCFGCGTIGDLLCCDGCDRSFHFQCLDVVISPEDLPASWYCYACAARKNPQPRPPRGLFGSLLGNIEKQNPRAFNLPAGVREYFDSVKTGKNGEYMEVTRKPTHGQDDPIDNFKCVSNKGVTIRCFRCGCTSIGQKPIIQCDYCPLYWHLDCIDPPMANPPTALDKKERKLWMCPNHIDHELRDLHAEIPTPAGRLSSHRLSSHSGNRRIFKVRKPKYARIVDTALRRGSRNNGVIEIENDPSDEEEQFFEEEDDDVIHRLSEKGIKLDFIHAAKRARHLQTVADSLQQPQGREAVRTQTTGLPSTTVQMLLQRQLNKLPTVDHKTVLNLVQLAQDKGDLNMNADETENLINTLIAEAPPGVVKLFSADAAAGSAEARARPHPASRPMQTPHQPQVDEKANLLMLQELIRRRLEGIDPEPEGQGQGQAPALGT
ncbi:MAG: hypothetical protein M1833_002975 [Piccolia ochrophora]|nr:MAG: hypothetical protein M1833_002975 [Piccolia ochrophora]